MRFLLHIAYKGTNYRGWQRQKAITSVQEVLESCIEKMFGQFVHCMGCGRTDAGVHASQFFCHLELEKVPDFDFLFRINKMLPDDISVYDLIPVAANFHAQHSAMSRRYEYFIHFEENPFLAELSYLHAGPDLNIKEMLKAVDCLPEHQDYRAFCKTPDVYQSTLCQISLAALQFNRSKTILRFSITSDRFLRNMVRLIVGNLIEIGAGNLSLNQFETSLQTGTPLPYFKAAYPQGLYLAKVIYPELEIPVRANWSSMFNFSE